MRKKSKYLLSAMMLLGILISGYNISYSPVSVIRLNRMEALAGQVGDVASSEVQREIDGIKYPADGATISKIWTSGNCTVSRYSDYTIVINGGTYTADYPYGDSSAKPPWDDGYSKVIIVGDEVERIGDMNFYYSREIVKAHLGNNIKQIGTYFIYSKNLTTVTNIDKVEIMRSPSIVGFTEPLNGGVLDLKNLKTIEGELYAIGQNSNPSYKTIIIPKLNEANMLLPTSKNYDITGNTNLKKVNECIYNADGTTLLITEKIDSKESLDLLDTCTLIDKFALQNANYESIVIPNRAINIKTQGLKYTKQIELYTTGTIYDNLSNSNYLDKLIIGKEAMFRRSDGDGRRSIDTFRNANIKELRIYGNLPDVYNGNGMFVPNVIVDKFFIDSNNSNNKIMLSQFSMLAMENLIYESGNINFKEAYIKYKNLNLKSYSGTSLPDYLGTTAGLTFNMGTALQYTYTVEGMNDNIVDIGYGALRNAILDQTDLVLNNVGFSGLQNSNITSVTVEGDTVGINAFAYCKKLKSATIDTKNVVNTSAFLGCSSLEKIYWLSGIDSSSNKTDLAATTMIFCKQGSPVETWCRNNNVAYTILTGDEVNDIINGKILQ